ncbi:MAG: hypothetical protein ACKJSG_18490, partial [Lentisphaeria bacterium]
MARTINWLPRVARRHREKGVAILLTLGVLSLTLVLVLSFAVTSTIDRRAAMNYADQVRARMLAESGLARAVGFLQKEMADKINSYDTFYRAPSGATWEGRAVTGSVNFDGSGREDIDDAFAVKFTGYDESLKSFLPTPTSDATLGASLGWLLIESTQDSSGNGSFSQFQTKVIGRLTYLIEDVSGYIDPNAWAVPGTSEGQEFPGSSNNRESSGNGSGFSVADLNLRDALPAAAATWLSKQWDYRANQKWYSYRHILSVQKCIDYADDMFQNLRPFSVPETSRQWWHDANSDNTIDTDELRDKLNLLDPETVDESSNVATGAVAIYNEMVGASLVNGAIDSDPTKYSPWLQDLANLGAGYDAIALRHIAGSTALNIQDYGDIDNEPKSYYIDAADYKLKEWTNSPADPLTSYESLVHGSEAGWHIGAFMLELQIYRRHSSYKTFRVQPYFNMEVFYADGEAPIDFNSDGYSVSFNYQFQVTAGEPGFHQSVTEKSDTYTTTCTPFSHSYLSSGGEVFADDNPKSLGSAHRVDGTNAYTNSAPHVDDISIDYLRLNRVILYKTATGEVADVVPEFASGSIIADFPVFQTITAKVPNSGSGVTRHRAYAGVYFRAKDPLCMKLYDGHPLQSTYLETVADSRVDDGTATESLVDLYIGPHDAVDDISIDYLRLNRVILYKTATGEVADVVPEFASGSIIADFPVFQTITAKVPNSGSGVTRHRAYAGVYFRAKDPLCMKLYDGHPLQSTYLETVADSRVDDGTATESLVDLYIGPHDAVDDKPSADPPTWNQSDQDYGGVEFADGFNDSQVYEIGRVKGYLPGRSLRLWSQASGDADTHDGRLLDLFYAP